MAVVCRHIDGIGRRTLESSLQLLHSESTSRHRLVGNNGQHCRLTLRKDLGRSRERNRIVMQLSETGPKSGSSFARSGLARRVGGDSANRAFRLQAVKKTSGEPTTEEDEWDPDFVEAMNQESMTEDNGVYGRRSVASALFFKMCNKAVRVMLSEDLQQVDELRKELDATGSTLVEHREIDAARFVLVVQEMLDHKLAPERDLLIGRFKEAFEKIFGLVEDAGWSLKPPEEEGEGETEEVSGSVAYPEEEQAESTKRVVEPYNRTFQAQDQFV